MSKHIKILLIATLFTGFMMSASDASAAITSQNTLGATSSKTANQSSIVLTTTNTAEEGRLVIVVVARDNTETTDARNATAHVTGVADSAGNTYTLAYDYTNGNNSTQSGAWVGVYYRVLTTQLTSGGTITATFANTADADASAISAWEYSIGSGNAISVQFSTQGVQDGVDPGSLSINSLASQEWLFFRGIAAETDNSTLTNTTNYTVISGANTTGNPEHGNMAVAGEFRIVTATSGTTDPTLGDTSNDNVSAFIAFKEVSPITLSGFVYQTNESSVYTCATTGNLTIQIYVDNVSAGSTTCTADTGAWSKSLTVSSGQTVYAFIDGGSIFGTMVYISDGSAKTDIDILQNRVVLRDDANGSITNSEISAGNTTDADDLISFSGSDITITSGNELHIYTGDTYAPGANVNTPKLHVVGTYNGAGTNTLTLTGTGTTTSRPLYINGGSFTANATTVFNGDGDVDIEGTTYNGLNLSPTITSGRSYTFLGAVTTEGLFQINPNAGSQLTLTVNLGGDVTSPFTFMISRQGSANSIVDTRPNSTDYNITTSGISLGTGTTLDASDSASVITLTSSTGISFGGTFIEGNSTVRFTWVGTGNLFNGPGNFYNLEISPTIVLSRTVTLEAATVYGDFTINPNAASALTYTVNMAGNVTVLGTTTITRTGQATSSLATTASNYSLSTGFLNIAAGGTLTAASSSSTITLTGTSGTLWTHSGTFTAGSSTVVFNPNADVTLFTANPTLYNLSLTPTISSTGKTYTVGSALTINNNFTINPTAATSLSLTVNAGGNITVAATGTTSITGTTSGTSNLDLRPVTTDYNLSTGFLNIASAGNLDATSASSTITLTGTSGTLWTHGGTFSAGSSTVLVANASGTPTLNSGTVTFYNLTINGTNITATTSADAITVTNTVTVETGETLSLAASQLFTHSGATLTLNGTISGSGTYVYQSATTFPTTGTISSVLRMDSTNNDQTMGARTYGGAVVLYNNSGASARNIAFSAGTLTFSSSLTLNAANTQSVTATGATHNPTINITGNLVGTAAGGTEDITTGTGVWTVSGNVDFTNINTFTATAGNTFRMNGAGATITSAGETLQNFAITGGSVSNTDNLDVNGTFTVAASSTFTHGAGSNIDINIAGNFTLASGATWVENLTSTSQVIFDGDLNYTDNNATKQSIGNVVIGASPDTTSLTTDFSAASLTVNTADFFNTCEYDLDIGDSNITINGTLDTSGTGSGVSPCSGGSEGDETTINLASTFTVSATGVVVEDASTLIMDNPSGTDTITMDGESLYNLTISPTGTIQFADTMDINNNLSITTGTLDLNSQTVTIAGNFDNDAAMLDGTATVTFDATSGTKTIDADGTGTEAFYNLVFNDGGGSATFQLTTLLDVDNNFTITGGTFDANGQNINIGNNYSNSDTFTANSNTVTFDAQDAGNTLSGTMTGTSSFYNLVFDDAGTTGTWSFGANSATATNNFTITGGTVTAPSTTLTIGANFTNNDGFTHNSGTVVFNNNAATSALTYSAATTFNNFSVTTASKALQFDETDQTNISGTFTLNGQSCESKITLDSTVNDDQFAINATGSVDINFVDVEDSNAIVALSATSSTEVNNNNTNWTINSDGCSPVNVRLFNNTRLQNGVRIKP